MRLGAQGRSRTPPSTLGEGRRRWGRGEQRASPPREPCLVLAGQEGAPLLEEPRLLGTALVCDLQVFSCSGGRDEQRALELPEWLRVL